MAPIKRKRAQDIVPEPPAPESITRRATRQTSIAPLPAQSDPEPRRRRRRADSNTGPEKIQANGRSHLGKGAGAAHTSQPYGGKENIPLPATHTGTLKPNRTTRLGNAKARTKDNTAIAGSPDTKNVGSSLSSPSVPLNGPLARSAIQPSAPRTSRNQAIERPPQQPTVSHMQTETLGSPGPPLQAQQQQQQQKRQAKGVEKAPGGRTDRNIDKVVLGNICFRAWYPSYYGKEVLGDIPGNSAKSATISAANGTTKEEGGGKSQGRRDRDVPPMLDRLYVCPSCFKYSKELVTWWEHVRVCEMRNLVPGKKIYTHPKGCRKVLHPSTAGSKFVRGRRGNVGNKIVEELVQDEGEWSIWEVDGENDVLFCQNLSLFAKLFLDNKSVFFDVTGFNYFLLVYTPPAPVADTHGEDLEASQLPRKQVVGFFSKEKLSWDNNNLACILIFPPWQRKGLGSLLMGISYEISKREGVLGGPEKPISDLGKKGYKRFWATEISRWLLSLDTMSDAGESIVSAEECSRATWIAGEDCLLILREMGVVEDAGKGPPPQFEEHQANAETEEDEKHDVQRVRISKEVVRRWVAANGISLQRACDPKGFIDGYALQPTVAENDCGQE